MALFRLTVATVLVLSGIVVQFMLKGKDEIPTFFIDLDKAPIERFKEVAQIYSYGIRRIAYNYKSAVRRKYNMSHDELNSIADNLGKQFKEEYREEISGIAKYAKMNINDIYFLHIHYDLSSMCTSVICVDKENVIWILRNFDYFGAKDLKGVIINLDFQKGNRSLFKGTTFAGLISMPNGIKRDSFVFSVNRRVTHSGTLEGNLRLAASQAESTGHVWPWALTIRRILTIDPLNFEDAVEEFSSAQLMAPTFIAIGGRKNNEGVIITRNRNEVVAKQTLKIANGTWFVMITNSDVGSDFWKTKEWRYHAIHKAMTKLIRSEINDEKAWNVLKASYFRRSVFSSLLSVESYYMSSIVAP